MGATVPGGYLLYGLILTQVLGIASVAFYRAFIHPLRKYPGPKLAAISRVPYLWNAYNGDLVRWVDRVHQKHGPIVRIAPYELSFTNPQAWKDIYGHATGGKKMLQKDLRFYNFKVLGRVADIVRSNDTNHARFRRNFSYAFSERALKAQEPLVAKYADLLVAKMNQIAESPGSKADIVRWYNFATFDIMSDLTFGDPLGQLESSEYNEFVTLVFDSVKTNMMAMITRYLPALQPLASILISKEAFEKRERHFRGCIDRVDKRLAKDNTRPDIWGLVMKETGETKLTLDEMYANSNSFMIGGTETTATLLSGLTYQLLQHPHIMEKLTNEIREAFPSDEEITLNNLTRVTYMHACIEEGFRLYPPVPGGLPRWTPPEGAVICDEVIPGNTVISVHQWATYRSPDNFKDPESFRPERWIDDGFASDKKHALQPFSMGPRNCIGKNLAYHEMRLILAKTLWHFDLSLCPESENWPDQKVYLIWEKNPLMVEIKKRKH